MTLAETVEDVAGDVVGCVDLLVDLLQSGELGPDPQAEALAMLRPMRERLGRFVGRHESAGQPRRRNKS